ncbi:MAG: IclR family transcriptional regulator [Proteobacteria bacterium]|nr:IclR family transcriptional regulator [Pseudomonadota bacterium]
MNTTFVNGLALLEALAHAGGPCGVTELARELGLTKSNVHRLLRTLSERGYVSSASGRYEITLRLWELGVEVLDKLDVKRVALDPMEKLAALTGETVHLSILDHGEVVYIDKVDSPQPVRAYSKIGGRAPAYCVATGKALLAHSAAAVVDAVARDLRRHTPNTITDAAELRAELRRAVEQGYAINRGEWRDGVCGLAAPIRDGRGRVIAAIGISGPVDRLKARVMKQCAPAVVEAARATSARLGWSGQAGPTAP